MPFDRPQYRSFRQWPYRPRLPLTLILIIINVGTFLLQLGISHFAPGWLETHLALSRAGLLHGELWQLVSYMFLHGGFLHLFVNCLALYFAGREVETVLGPKHFLYIYFLGGIAGGLLQLLVGPSSIELIGASAGVCAILLAFTTIMAEVEITLLLYFILPLKMKAKWLGRLVILSSIVFAFIGFGSDIGHIAHLGGALFGLFYVSRLGYGRSWLREFLEERKARREELENLPASEFISREIDPILDKISREGIHSLTRSERKILEKGRATLERKVTTAPR